MSFYITLISFALYVEILTLTGDIDLDPGHYYVLSRNLLSHCFITKQISSYCTIEQAILTADRCMILRPLLYFPPLTLCHASPSLAFAIRSWGKTPTIDLDFDKLITLDTNIIVGISTSFPRTRHIILWINLMVWAS